MKKLLFACFLIVTTGLLAHAARPKIVAHRGYWNTEGSAQNSIRALVKADSIGADMAEFDVWIASDDVLMVNHDPVVDGYMIPDTTSTVLRRNVRLANGEPIRTVDEYLDVAKDLNIGLVFEIKWHVNTEREALCVKKSIEAINKRGLADRTIYITFSPTAHAELGKYGVPHYFLSGKSPAELVEMGSDGPDFHYEVFYKNTDFIPEFKRLGMPVNVWTVSTPEITQDFIDLDVDYITTDTPELALKLRDETPSSKDVRVMDFNLEGAESFEAAASVIRAEHPDFVTLQGVRNSADLNRLGDIAGMYTYFCANDKNGVAIMSKLTPTEVMTYTLPNQFRNVPCKAIVCTYDLGNAIKVNIASASMSDWNDVTREHQAEFITRKLRDAAIPAILGAGLNDKPKSKPWEIMMGRFTELSPADVTFPAPVPDRKIDFLSCYPADKVEKRNSYVRPSAASFHMPVIADVTVKY
ncbi:MAG: hypothetical protein NC082_08290 [Clostridiales bacterium]|nr:hypothetical protein [Clostridiales bacterium]